MAFITIVLFVNDVSIPIVIILALVTVAAGTTMISQTRKIFNNQYKTQLIDRALKDSFENLFYDHTRGIPESEIDRMDMMQLGNLYESNDYIKATYNDVDFETSDVFIGNQTTDSEGHTQTTVYFKGRWMIFDFNKNFKYHLQVCEKGFSYAKRTKASGKMEKIKMEDPTFNKNFNIYASSEHEAYYILTPHIMQRMLELKEQVKGRLLLCFDDNRLHIAVNNSNDSFEPSATKRITEASVKNEVVGEIDIITSFAENLKLDKKIWVYEQSN